MHGKVSTGYGDNLEIILCVTDFISIYHLTGIGFEIKFRKRLPTDQKTNGRKYINPTGNVYLQTSAADIHEYSIQISSLNRVGTVPSRGKMLSGITDYGMYFASWPVLADGSRYQKLSHEMTNGEMIHNFSDKEYEAGEYIRIALCAAKNRTVVAARDGQFMDIFEATGE